MGAAAASERAREFPFTQRDFDYLRTLTRSKTGIVVDDDKFDMFYSRLSRRVRQLRLGSFAEYCDRIRAGDAEEEGHLINAITTNLTAFFRENHHFEYLANTLVPEFLANGGREFRIWSAGCSTGEEPYSLAITLLEAGLPARARVTIKATDLDSNVLATARAGVYDLTRVEGISPARRKRWFLKGTGVNSGKVRVKDELKKPIEFGQLNLMSDWSVPPQDVIFCRNVIIYFDKETKQRLVDRYAEALAPGGYLVIGHSESLYKVSERFESLGNTIYRKLR